MNNLKSRANRLGLILQRDPVSRNFKVHRRGVAGCLYEGINLKGVSGFLGRHEKTSK